MSVQSNSIFGRLANQIRNSESLFFDARLSKEAIHVACLALGQKFRDRIYSPAITVWMFIGQVLSSDQSCRDAISRLNVWRVARGMRPASTETASYVEARQRLPEKLLLELARSSADESASQSQPNWLWKDRVVKTVDGFTVT
ncbi:MAG: IS4/IS5 family transposase, partial [Pirellulaceae bacterium]|nr:IS4/IS5 family transposase [Pirellulaceae bacterium]